MAYQNQKENVQSQTSQSSSEYKQYETRSLSNMAFNQLSSESFESLKRNPNQQKVVQYLLNDRSHQVNQSPYKTEQLLQEQQQQFIQQQILHDQQQKYVSQQQQRPAYLDKQYQSYQNESSNPNLIGRSQSGFAFDKTFPNPSFGNSANQMSMPLGVNFEISKSVDCNVLSPKGLIESCLTFNGNNVDEDMSFLNQAMHPDKIFDLPLAMVKVQKAFQQSNQNAIKLKESLELVLQRESLLQQKYEKVKQQFKKQIVSYEQEIIQGKQKLKDQLTDFTSNVQILQQQIQERDQALTKSNEKLNQFYVSNQEMRAQLDLKYYRISELEKTQELFQNQQQKKQRDFDELRQQFEMLKKAEEDSSRDMDIINSKSNKEIQILRNLIEEKNLVIDVLQKDLECARQERKMANGQEEKLMQELSKIKLNLKDDIERKYLELIEYKKQKDEELEELRYQFNSKCNKVIELQRCLERNQDLSSQQEDDLQQHRSEINKLNDINRDAIIKQREQYEKRMKEMEEEVTQLSLSRYKHELDQKQKFLKSTKKYDEQLRELRSAMGYLLSIGGVEQVPEYLRDDLTVSIQETTVSKELMRALQEFQNKFDNAIHNKEQKFELQNIRKQYDDLLKAYRTELMYRRGLHNQIQELKGNIRVLCRIRPLLNHENKGRKKDSQAIQYNNLHKLTITSSQKNREQVFNFDRVFEANESQQEIQEEVHQLVTSSLDGYNVCIMAYGQTGSGKTYTMIGNDDNPGLYFSSVDDIFTMIQDRKKLIEYEVTASFVEIYNETLRDLLSKKGQAAGQQLKLRENGDGETIGDQITKKVKSKNQVLQLLQEACTNRTIGVTHYNEQSSRSHFIFTLNVIGRHKENKQVFKGRLNLIDLAGSERIMKSQAEGDRIKEALNINQSLTTLGKVFLSLLNKASHVPYRDSKLTHYLKDSLGGESKTMLIIQVSPSINDHNESVSSLSFGQRVSCIEKGQIRQTIESPNRSMVQDNHMKRNKSTNQRMHVEFEIPTGSATPKNQVYGSPKRIM